MIATDEPFMTTIRASIGMTSVLYAVRTVDSVCKEHTFKVRAVSFKDAIDQVEGNLCTHRMLSIELQIGTVQGRS